MIPDFELLEKIENQVQPESQQADCILFYLCYFITRDCIALPPFELALMHLEWMTLWLGFWSVYRSFVRTSVRSLTLDWQGWMLSLSVWISSRQKWSTLLLSLTTEHLLFYGVINWLNDLGFLFRGKKFNRLVIVLLTDLNIQASSDQLDVVIENLKAADIILQFL